MADQIRLSYNLDIPMMMRGMSFAGARAQSMAGGGSISRWVISAAVILGIAGLDTVLRSQGIELVNAGFVAGMLMSVLILALVQRQAVSRIARVAVESAQRRGPVRFTAGAGGISEQSGIGRIDVVWDAVQEITGLRDSTIIRFGGMCFVVPDAALPEDLPPDVFRERLQSWYDADAARE